VLIAGNWKMFKGPAASREFLAAFSPPEGVDVVIAPPYVSLATAVESGSCRVFAQNVHWADEGAYTGEVSPSMLRELGVAGAIVGHSERRQYFGETDEGVAKKTKAALAARLLPISCVGETLAEREAARTMEVVGRQTRAILDAVTADEAKTVVIAYEPVWAIGTGKVATPEQAQEVHAFIRSEISKKHGQGVADALRILYGGSVKPDNVKGLMSLPDVDGALVGGASLKADSFLKLVRFDRA
jgi:triosephosphate isomerase